METLAEILDAFGQLLTLEKELGTRTVEFDRALLVDTPVAAKIPAIPTPPPSQEQKVVSGGEAAARAPAPAPMPAAAKKADFAFLLECEPKGAVLELLKKMSAAIGYGEDGVLINNPSARVLIVLGAEAMRKWMPGARGVPGQWLALDDTPALITASPTKTYRFFANDPAKIRLLKIRLRDDLTAALAKIGKTPPWKKK